MMNITRSLTVDAGRLDGFKLLRQNTFVPVIIT